MQKRAIHHKVKERAIKD